MIRGGGAQNAPPRLPLRTFGIEVIFGEHAFRQLRKPLVKLTEGLQYLGRGFGNIRKPYRFSDGRVDVITAQFFHTQHAGFQLEEALEHSRVRPQVSSSRSITSSGRSFASCAQKMGVLWWRRVTSSLRQSRTMVWYI